MHKRYNSRSTNFTKKNVIFLMKWELKQSVSIMMQQFDRTRICTFLILIITHINLLYSAFYHIYTFNIVEGFNPFEPTIHRKVYDEANLR